jgi:hypothetical protein
MIQAISRYERAIALKREIKIKSRNELPLLLNKLGLTTMIEIGVKEGEYADAVLSQWPIFNHYWGIDAWQHQANYIDSANVNEKQQINNYNTTLAKLTKKYGKDRISLIRSYSTDAVKFFKNESIDFVFIDARHDYCGCYEDLVNYLPVLKCGGLMAGHDYVLKGGSSAEDWDVCANGTRILGSVKRAVNDFAARNGVEQVYSTSVDHWFFFKRCF